MDYREAITKLHQLIEVSWEKIDNILYPEIEEAIELLNILNEINKNKNESKKGFWSLFNFAIESLFSVSPDKLLPEIKKTGVLLKQIKDESPEEIEKGLKLIENLLT